MEIKRVGIVGLGQKGSGIGQVFAQPGNDVIALDSSEEVLQKALKEAYNIFSRMLNGSLLSRNFLLKIKQTALPIPFGRVRLFPFRSVNAYVQVIF